MLCPQALQEGIPQHDGPLETPLTSSPNTLATSSAPSLDGSSMLPEDETVRIHETAFHDPQGELAREDESQGKSPTLLSKLNPFKKK